MLDAKLHRRRFLKYSGLAVASTAVISVTGCDNDDKRQDLGVDLGSGDVGILNYAYALEQLEVHRVHGLHAVLAGERSDEHVEHHRLHRC